MNGAENGTRHPHHPAQIGGDATGFPVLQHITSP